MKAVFGLLAVGLSLLGYIPYVVDILRGAVKPQRVTWGIWTVLAAIICANQIANGGGWSSWFFGSSALVVTLIFVLSLRRGVGGSSALDKTMLAAALLLLGAWFLTGNTRQTTMLAILIDAAGAIPTVVKAYQKPQTESYPQWVMAAIAGLFSLLAIGGQDYILYLYPLYIIAINCVIVWAKFYAEHERAATAHP